MKGVIQVYTASWCPACRKMEPVLRKLERNGYRVVRKVPGPYMEIPYFVGSKGSITGITTYQDLVMII